MPLRSEIFGALTKWLRDNGIENIKLGWFDPAEEGADKCAYPVAALIPEPAPLEPSDSGSILERGTIRVVLWVPKDGSVAFSPTFGGWPAMWALHDKLLAGSKSQSSVFPQYVSAQLEILPETWEDYWWSGKNVLPLGAEFVVKIYNRIGPETA